MGSSRQELGGVRSAQAEAGWLHTYKGGPAVAQVHNTQQPVALAALATYSHQPWLTTTAASMSAGLAAVADAQLAVYARTCCP
jgi:hypothetical protein